MTPYQMCWYFFSLLMYAMMGNAANTDGIDMGCVDPDRPLLLTPMIEKNQTAQARLASFVHRSFLEDFVPPSHAGYFTVDADLGNHMFFWFFPCETERANFSAPLLLWLNGGPTVTSMLGLFHETGPIEIDGKGSRRHIPAYYPRRHSWTKRFSMLYVDNPVNVGFSHSESGERGDTFTEPAITKNLYSVLQQFLAVFTEYRDRPLYIGGQSYAGMYTISLGHYIHTQLTNGRKDVHLTGIYLGGPYFDPETQLKPIAAFAYHMGAISYKTLIEYKQIVDIFFEKKERFLNATNSLSALIRVFFPWSVNDNLVTLEIPPYKAIEALMNSPDIKRAVHAGRKTEFRSFAKEMRKKFLADTITSRVPKLDVLLDNYKILMHNGDLDALVSTASIDASIMRTPWSKQDEFNDAPRYQLARDHKIVLSFTHVGQMCRVVIRGAGHQTPYDQPETTLRVMDDFITHGCVTKAKDESVYKLDVRPFDILKN